MDNLPFLQRVQSRIGNYLQNDLGSNYPGLRNFVKDQAIPAIGRTIRGLIPDQKIVSPLPSSQQRPIQQIMPSPTPTTIPLRAPTPTPRLTEEQFYNAVKQRAPNMAPQRIIQEYRRSQPTPTPTPTMAPPQQLNIGNQPTASLAGFTTAQVPLDYLKLINNAASRSGIHPAVLASLLFSEHGFSRDPGIHQNVDANGNPIPGNYDRGPGQINTIAHPDVTDAQAYDLNFAIPWVADTLKRYIQQAGGLANGLAAYNVGVGGATVNGIGGILGTRGTTYLNKIKQGLSAELKKQLGL